MLPIVRIGVVLHAVGSLVQGVVKQPRRDVPIFVPLVDLVHVMSSFLVVAVPYSLQRIGLTSTFSFWKPRGF